MPIAHQAMPSQIRRFSVLQALYWAFVGTFFAFIIDMFTSQGVSSERIGIMMSVMTIGSCIGQFIISYACDRLESCKKVFIATLILLQLFCCALFLTKNLILINILMFLIGFTKQPLGAVLDTWFIKGVSDDMRAFGKIRSFGSAGFSILILFYGSLLTRFGYGIMPYISTVFLGVLVFLCFKTPDMPRYAQIKRTDYNLSAIFHSLSPLLLFLFLGTTLLGAANNPSYNFTPKILKSLGGTTTHLGIALFINSGMEIPAMRIKWDNLNLSPAIRLLISSGLYIISTFLMAYSNAVWQVIALLSLSGFAFGMSLHARRALVAQLSPGALQSTMHGVGDMLYSGLGPIAGSAICGKLLDISGMRLMLLFCVALQTLGTVFILIMYIYGRNRSIGVNQKADPIHDGFPAP